MDNPNEIKAAVHPLYAVPLLQSTLPGAEPLNADLARLFLALEAEGDRHRDRVRRDTQYGLFESNFHLHLRREPPVRRLFDFIRGTLLSFIGGMNAYDEATTARLDLDMHAWFHVTRTGGFQSSHNHPNASWSAIYCVDPGDHDSAESGAVRFHDPRIGSDMFQDPANANLQIPYKICPWQLKHRPGQMIAFPSYLVHEVFPYLGTRPRIVVALNSWCRWKDGTAPGTAPG